MAQTDGRDAPLLPTIALQPSSGANTAFPSSNSSIHSPLASLSRNTSVISSSSSSSSSSLVLTAPVRPRPIRSFSSQNTSASGQNDRARSPHSPTTPKFNRAPTYLQRQLGISESPPADVSLPPALVTDMAGMTVGSPPRPKADNTRSSSAVRRLYSPDDFEFGDVLGEGSYSTVLSGVYRRTGQAFALKVLDKHHLQRVNKVKYAYVEKDSLARLSTAGHPGVVKLHWAFSDAMSLYFVLDKVNNGELNSKINTLGSLSTECARYYTAQMVDAICWMHSLGVLHRDMKPENVLLDDDMRIKITDFGTAKVLDEKDTSDGQSSSFVGSPGYISPELLISSSCGKSADFWAIGCILFQMIAGQQPFKALTAYLSMEKTKKAEYTFPEGFDPVAKDLVEKLLVLEPTARLGDAAQGGPDTLRAHPFFDDTDWATLWTRPAPPLEAGLVKREVKRKRGGPENEDLDDEDTDEETKARIGAAWNALVHDLSESEMDAAEDEDDDTGTIGDRNSVLLPPPRRRFPMHDEEGALIPSAPSSMSSSPADKAEDIDQHDQLSTAQPSKRSSFASGISSSEENAQGTATPNGRLPIPSAPRSQSRGRRKSKQKDNASQMPLLPPPPSSTVMPGSTPDRPVIARDTYYPDDVTQLSSSAPAAYHHIAESAFEKVGRPSMAREASGISTQPSLPGASLSVSPVSSEGLSSEDRVDPSSAKLSGVLQPGEKAIFSSSVRARRRSILPARLKPRILVLTDLPRLLCLKVIETGSGGDSVGGSGSKGDMKIKSEVHFAPALGTSTPSTLAALTTDRRLSTPGDAMEGSRPGIFGIPVSVSANTSAVVESVSASPTFSSLRPRTFSTSTGTGRRRGRSTQRRDPNVLKGVESKGDRSFVIQTDGKWYTYLADDQALASRWVQEIKSVPISSRINQSRGITP